MAVADERADKFRRTINKFRARAQKVASISPDFVQDTYEFLDSAEMAWTDGDTYRAVAKVWAAHGYLTAAEKVKQIDDQIDELLERALAEAEKQKPKPEKGG